MGLFSGVLLASDFDGTLSAGKAGIPERVRRAVSEFTSEGGFFTVSTGRTYLGFHAYDPELINAPVMLANGGMIYDYTKKEIVALEGIDREAIPSLRAIKEKFPTVSIEMYAFKETFCLNVHDKAHRHFTSQDIPYQSIDDPAEARGPWAKIMLGGEPEEIAEVQKFISANCPELGYVPTTGGYLEVLKPGMHKGSLLRILAAKLGVRDEDTYAAGDGYNDVDMLRIASAAFVPSNGDEFAKACATYVVCSNEEGAIADAIEILRKIYTEKRA
ncbi:MAG: HAD-IIB family hydrolase, partial [Eubacteriales bacterium]